jgi:imidazolonepropionase-like amidohydrolase
MRISNLVLLTIAFAATSVFAQPATDVLIHDAKIHTVASAGVLEHGDVLIHAGKIAEISARGIKAPQGAVVVEANGRPLTPGMFAGLSHIGI